MKKLKIGMIGAGTGDANLPRVFTILKKAGFDGHSDVEYEGRSDCIESLSRKRVIRTSILKGEFSLRERDIFASQILYVLTHLICLLAQTQYNIKWSFAFANDHLILLSSVLADT